MAEPVTIDLGYILGDRGPQGPAGATGPKGDNGLKATMAIGTVTELAPGEPPSVAIESINESTNTYTLSFGLPSANPGSSDIMVKAEDITGLATVASDDSVSTKVMHKTTSTTAATLFNIIVDPIDLGSYSIITRMRTSNITNTANFLKILVQSVYPDGTTVDLKTVYIKPTYFSSANVWESVSFGVNFVGKRGSQLKVTFSSEANSTSFTYDIDYITILKNGTALGSIG